MCSWEIRLSEENITSFVSVRNNRVWSHWAEPIIELVLKEVEKRMLITS